MPLQLKYGCVFISNQDKNLGLLGIVWYRDNYSIKIQTFLVFLASHIFIHHSTSRLEIYVVVMPGSLIRQMKITVDIYKGLRGNLVFKKPISYKCSLRKFSGVA